mmetsp:Transcript_7098/g.12748  ORF Transcript_7098/g.12748 Transcript_7098/m.12748 type:complete len:122 (-) Transcript_7098:470-835(-)
MSTKSNVSDGIGGDTQATSHPGGSDEEASTAGFGVQKEATAAATGRDESEPNNLEFVNDPEIMLLRNLRRALGSTLRMLESARDDLVIMGERMDRLSKSSEHCRTILEQRSKVENQTLSPP